MVVPPGNHRGSDLRRTCSVRRKVLDPRTPGRTAISAVAAGGSCVMRVNPLWPGGRPAEPFTTALQVGRNTTIVFMVRLCRLAEPTGSAQVCRAYLYDEGPRLAQFLLDIAGVSGAHGWSPSTLPAKREAANPA